MRFDYWTVTAVPEPMSITRIGFGLIVVDPRSGEFKTYFRPVRSLVKLYPRLDFLSVTKKNLERDLQIFRHDSLQSLPVTHELTLDGFMGQLHADWNNAVRISSKASMDAQNIESAVALLSEKLSGAERDEAQRISVSQLRQQLVTTYRKFPKLEVATTTNVNAHAGRWDIDLTSAVMAGERIYELNQSFIFAHSSANEASVRANYWALRIEKLRKNGGNLELSNGRIAIESNIPVVAFMLPPNSGHQQQEYDETVEYFKDLKIAVHTTATIHGHAAELNELIA